MVATLGKNNLATRIQFKVFIIDLDVIVSLWLCVSRIVLEFCCRSSSLSILAVLKLIDRKDSWILIQRYKKRGSSQVYPLWWWHESCTLFFCTCYGSSMYMCMEIVSVDNQGLPPHGEQPDVIKRTTYVFFSACISFKFYYLDQERWLDVWVPVCRRRLDE